MPPIKIRRLTESELSGIILERGEPAIDITNWQVYVGDGQTNHLVGTLESLDDIDDMTFASVADNDVIFWDDTDQKWENASLTELNIASELVSFSVGAESSNVIQVTVTAPSSSTYGIDLWLSDSQPGAETATAPDGGVSWSTGTVLETITASKRWKVLTDSTGQAVVDITESSTGTWYLCAEIAGKVYASAAITFS